MTKKVIVDGKPVLFKSKTNSPSISTIRKAYSLIPDNKKIPVVFETKNQYLNEYIGNQEKKNKVKFSSTQKAEYKRQELNDMKNIVSRYTTDHNPYIDRRVVFFTDKKLPKTQFTKSVLHEYGHELWEKKPRIQKDWSTVNKSSSPTPYGKTDKQEDFAESYMLYKTGNLNDPRRKSILSKDISSKNDVNNQDQFNLIIGNSEFRKKKRTCKICGKVISYPYNLCDSCNKNKSNDFYGVSFGAPGVEKFLSKDKDSNDRLYPVGTKFRNIERTRDEKGNILTYKTRINNKPDSVLLEFNTLKEARLIAANIGDDDFKMSDLDVNHDGKINDEDMNIIRKKEMYKDKSSKNMSLTERKKIKDEYNNEFENDIKNIYLRSGERLNLGHIENVAETHIELNEARRNNANTRLRSNRLFLKHSDPSNDKDIFDDLKKQEEELVDKREAAKEFKGELKNSLRNVTLTKYLPKRKISDDEYSKNSVADALGIDVPDDYLFSDSWKVWGGQKSYDPRTYEHANLIENITNITGMHINKLRSSNSLGGPSSDVFGLNDEVQVEETTNPKDTYVDINKEKNVKRAFQRRGISIVSIPNAKNEPSPMPSNKGDVTQSFKEKGLEVVNIPNAKSEPTPLPTTKIQPSIVKTLGKKVIGVLPFKATPKTTSRINEAKTTLNKGTVVGQYFLDKENAERKRLSDIDKERNRQASLQRLQALKSQGLLSRDTSNVLGSMQTINALGGNVNYAPDLTNNFGTITSGVTYTPEAPQKKELFALQQPNPLTQLEQNKILHSQL